MSSPPRTKALQAAHCPSLHPCMSIRPCSDAARSTVCSSCTSISMPTGSKRTTWDSPMNACFPPGWGAPGRAARGRAGLPGLRWWGLRTSAEGRCRASSRPAADVVRVEGLLLLGRHLVEQDVRALQRRAPTQVVERPHLLRVQVEVRLRHQRLAVVADVAHVGHDIGPVPPVVEGLPLALADEGAHVGGLPALVGRAERLDVRPSAGLVTVGPHLPLDLGPYHVLTDEAGDHAGPAPVRVLVGHVLEDDWVVPVRHREPVVVLPPGAVLVVPARVLVLEPLEVLVGHRVHAPVVGEPTGAEELGDLVDVALVPDLVPGLLDEVVRDDEAVLLERHEIAAVVVVVDPPPPHLRVALAVLATVLGAVLDEGADRGVDDPVVVPPRVAQIALEELVVALVGERHEEGGVAVADVPRLVGLHRVEDR